MADAHLVLHKGARLVELDELREVKAPPPEGRWFPLAHVQVLDRVKTTLGEAGYVVRREQLALSRGDARFFGTLDLDSTLAPGVTLAAAVRNSVDKSFPIGFCCGSRCFCCDNLSFRAELMVRRKHSRFGEQRFATDIATAIVQLGQFKEVEAKRIRLMQLTEISNERAESLMLTAFEAGIVSAPLLPQVISHWRRPQHEEFEPRNLFSLLNAFTSALGEKAKTNPHGFAVTTMRLSKHLEVQDAAPALAS